MIKIKKFYALFLLIAAFTYISPVMAFLPPPPGPVSPTVDPGTDPMMILNSVTKQVQTVQAQASAYMQQLNQQAKAMFSQYVGKFKGFAGGIFKKKQKQELPGSKQIQKSKIANIEDPASVQEAMYTLFFEYPADCSDAGSVSSSGKTPRQMCDEYQIKASEFHQDTLVELYTAVRELEKQLPTLKDSVNQLEQDLQAGNNGAEDPNDENGAWKNAYNAYETMNSILKIIEEVSAMRAQYIAAQAIGNRLVSPKTPTADKEAFLNDKYFTTPALRMASAHVKNTEQLAFGQVASILKNEAVSLVAAPSSKLSNPFGSAEHMDSLQNINDAYTDLQQAVVYHNQTKTLEGVRTLYDTYNKAVKLHNKAVERLRASEKCAVRYMSDYYNDPQKAWDGGLMGGDVTKHDFRKGISGWALQAYNQAKSEETELVSNDDYDDSFIDKSNVKGGLGDIDSMAADLQKSGRTGLKDQGKMDQLTEDAKLAELLPWNVGAKSAAMLAEKQSSWGSVKKTFPLWNDIKGFYVQYLDGKYDNIKARLNDVNVNNTIIKVARALNSFVADATEKQNNLSGLNKLEQRLNNESLHSDIVDTVRQQHKAALDQALAQKNTTLKQLQSRQASYEKQLSSLGNQLAAMNSELQSVNDKLVETDEAVNTLKKHMETILKRETDVEDTVSHKLIYEEYEQVIAPSVSIDKVQDNKLNVGTFSKKTSLIGAQLSRMSARGIAEPIQEKGTYTQVKTQDVVIEHELPDSYNLKVYQLKEHEDNRLSLQSQQSSLQSRIASGESSIADLKTQLSDVKTQLEAVESNYAANVSRINAEYKEKIEEAMRQHEATVKKEQNIDLADYFMRHIGRPAALADGTPAPFSLVEILNQATGLTNDTRSAAEQLVNNARRRIDNMGDAAYPASGHQQIASIHKQLIKDLQEIPVSELAGYSASLASYRNYTSIMQPLSRMYQTFIVGSACLKDSCLPADNEYYVSINGKDRDFKTPKAAPFEYLPPVREALYFDYEDYNSLFKKYAATGYSVPREEFADYLNKYMLHVPMVWKLLLKQPVFVEKDIDLQTLLNQGGETRVFSRGGIYPCNYNNQYIVDAVNGEYEIYYNDPTVEAEQKPSITGFNLPSCTNLDINRDKHFYFTVKNISEDVSGGASGKDITAFRRTVSASELGILLDGSNGGIKLRSLPAKAFKSLSDEREKQSGKGSLSLALADIGNLKHNQIQDFLFAADMEQSTAQNMIETKVELENAKKTLYDMFEQIGFVPTADFDLSKTSDYNLARNTLLREKNKLVNSAKRQLSNLRSDNEVVEERLGKMQRLSAALDKDSDAYTMLSELSEANAELDEMIKSEKTNREVSDRYEKQADDGFEKELNANVNPYCAVY